MTRPFIGMKTMSALFSQVVAVAAALLFSSSAPGATEEITAVFRPDPGNPMVNQFENTTPPGGYCRDHPTYCQNGVFSINFPINFNAVVPIQPLDEIRNGPMFQVPSWLTAVTVRHREMGHTEQVLLRVSGIGGAHEQTQPLHEGTWEGGNWVNAPSPCQYGGVGYGNAYYYGFFWRVPPGAGVCFKRPTHILPDFKYSNLSISYELITPNPLGMLSGTYEGTHTFLIGPGQDFDMGDVMLPDDNVLTLNFVLDVEHALKVELPAGGNRIELVPQGGWQTWLNQGRKPARLFRDQTFHIYVSSRFKMQLECERVIGDTCALKNGDGHKVPLDISVSLPHGLTRPDGSGVDRQPLLLSGAGTEEFQPGFYVNHRPGTLHFEVKKEHADTMVAQGGTTYSGQVTVVWDSEL
ncbi:hypothetical protein C4J93_1100 [Pseudomonas sp. R2-37-08W]|uniref:hypothetical protein n=1 Tax=Pseudomonas sp. R2-37-08W TaxID=1173273 RepID=UPI000F6D704D|nr:hypothetical protein [Pseudomonas sp. R2-37-08W]AZF09314.1 hypothetical protein C4J93_1100 [Pseudomonas sp. R2-37-08W]